MKIVEIKVDGEPVKIYRSQAEAARELNVKASSISRAIRIPKYTAGGHYFMTYEKYLEKTIRNGGNR